MPHLSVALFGPPVVMLDGRDVTTFGYEKVRTLLLYLMVEADHDHRRDVLAAFLWPEQSETTARTYLRRAIFVLRQITRAQDPHPPSPLQSQDTIHFTRRSEYELDVATFTTLLSTCRQHADPRIA